MLADGSFVLAKRMDRIHSRDQESLIIQMFFFVIAAYFWPIGRDGAIVLWILVALFVRIGAICCTDRTVRVALGDILSCGCGDMCILVYIWDWSTNVF